MPENTDFLKDYVQVKDRVAALFELYGQARIETTYEITREPDDRPKVIARAMVYRNAEDAFPAGTGTSWLYLPGTTNFTKNSEVENAETSAVGRAIGFLGILTEKGMATANEIAAKQDAPLGERNLRTETNGGLIGIATKQTARTTDFELRQSPDGAFLGFRLKEGNGAGVICEVRGPLAEALVVIRTEVVDQRVQVWGTWVEYKPPAVQHAYRAYRVERIQTPDAILPAPDDVLDPELASLPMFTEGAAA